MEHCSVHSENEKGFTLVEMIVVLVIIVLLASLVAPKLFPEPDKGRQPAAKVRLELFDQALDQFRLDVGRYPTAQEGLNVLIANSGIEKWDEPYPKKRLPKDPWDKPYIYQSSGTHNEYDLFYYGMGGVPGGEGEDKDIVSWE